MVSSSQSALEMLQNIVLPVYLNSRHIANNPKNISINYLKVYQTDTSDNSTLLNKIQ